MKYLKINLEESANSEKLMDLLLMIKGVKSVEVLDDENTESDLKKAINSSKEKLKSGDYESLVNDIFDTFLNHKKQK